VKKILITGGSGLIGARLLQCLDKENEVFALARTGSVPGATHTLNIDLGQPWSATALPKDIDIIVHLAQSNHYREFPHRAEDVFNVNTASAVRLLAYAREIGVKQFVLASSGGIYGTRSYSFSEDEKIIAKGDLGFYLATRLCSELLSDSYASFMNIISLRFFFAYGPGQRAQMLIPRLVNSVRSGTPIKLIGEDGLKINPIYVDDAVRAVQAAMVLQGSHKINVAGPEVLSLRKIADMIGDALGKRPEFEILPASGNSDLIADIQRMSIMLDEPDIFFANGIKAYISSLSV
jgi:UDP-glucose 4-epimerase